MLLNANGFHSLYGYGDRNLKFLVHAFMDTSCHTLPSMFNQGWAYCDAAVDL